MISKIVVISRVNFKALIIGSSIINEKLAILYSEAGAAFLIFFKQHCVFQQTLFCIITQANNENDASMTHISAAC